jgi:hypothetical protein
VWGKENGRRRCSPLFEASRRHGAVRGSGTGRAGVWWRGRGRGPGGRAWQRRAPVRQRASRGEGGLVREGGGSVWATVALDWWAVCYGPGLVNSAVSNLFKKIQIEYGIEEN